MSNHAERLSDGTICHLGERDNRRRRWAYSLWRDDRCVATGTLDLSNIRFHTTPAMAAKLVALTEGVSA